MPTPTGYTTVQGIQQYSFNGVQLTLASGGNVGINQVSPSYQLDVNGTARIALGSIPLDSSPGKYLTADTTTGQIKYVASVGGSSTTITISNVTGTSLTSSTTPALTGSNNGTYFNITNSGFSAITLPSTSGLSTGAFWVLRNNTSAYLSVTITYTSGSGITSPIAIPPANSATIAWDGTNFDLF